MSCFEERVRTPHLTPLDLGGRADTEAPELLALALVELERVHRAELARLLREAARRRLGLTGSSREILAAGFEEALHLAAEDGLAWPRSVLSPAWSWLAGEDVEPSQLARASLRVEDSLEGRRLLARVLVSARECPT